MQHFDLRVSFVVLALLQLCRAQEVHIPRPPPPWYTANIVQNDISYSPKPISELFSTEPPTSLKPIVVLSTSSPPVSNTALSSTYSTLAPTTWLSTLSSISSTESSSADPTAPPTFQPRYVQPNLAPDPVLPLLQAFQNQNTPAAQPAQFSIPAQDRNSTNYIVIYQNAPQNVQNYPDVPSTVISSSRTSPFTTAVTPSTISSTQFSSTSPPSELQSSQFISPTSQFIPPSSQFTSPTPQFTPTSAAFTPTSTPFTPPSSQSPSTFTTSRPNCVTNAVTSLRPNVSTTRRPTVLRIRMIAPVGSVTNLRLNPTTTTRRPLTTRRRRNDFDVCMDSCRGRRTPICTNPRGVNLADTTQLKGFPSVCHLACNNNFGQTPYVKVADGRCGRLRTRIRTLERNKLKRDDLRKAQYTIDGTPQPYLEIYT